MCKRNTPVVIHTQIPGSILVLKKCCRHVTPVQGVAFVVSFVLNTTIALLLSSGSCCYFAHHLLLFLLFLSPSVIGSSLPLMCIVHPQPGARDACLECLCYILLLIHFPLPSFSLPTLTHEELPASAELISEDTHMFYHKHCMTNNFTSLSNVNLKSAFQ